MALNRQELERTMTGGCQEPGCTHKHDKVLFFHGRCHPNAWVQASYKKGSGVVQIACGKCGRLRSFAGRNEFMKSKPYWLIHHARLLEWNSQPITHRRRYIKSDKPPSEIPIRLKWMKPLKRPDLLPKAVVKAWDDWNHGRITEEQKDLRFRRNWAAIVARHKKEYPGCPFDYPRKTLIFPESRPHQY